MNVSNDHPIFKKYFRDIYPCYGDKVERKGYPRKNVDEVVAWLMGYTSTEIKELLESDVTLGEFVDQAPQLNPLRAKITGRICGLKLDELKEGRMRELRYLDKLVDEIATGKSMDKIKRH